MASSETTTDGLALPTLPTNEDGVGQNGEAKKAALPVEKDIMQLARLGEIAAIQKLFESGEFDITYKDEENITPLHWAAINNQYALCKYLIEAGADVNIKGGESVATPAMWATQRCHTYIVNLFLNNGADPLLTDSEGYNILHLATFDGNVLLITYLLHQNISVDLADPHGHTPLMWAAYKGFPACVDLFLKWGADIHATDETGFTPLHWALVKGSQGCIQKLIEYGSDRFAKTSTGKSPSVIAEEMKSLGVWQRALLECGYDLDGNTVASRLPFASLIKGKRKEMSRFFFFWPFLIIWCVVMILSHMVIFVAVPIALIVAYTLQWVAQQALQWAPTDMRSMHKTPFLAGIFAGSCFWVGVRWLFTILPASFSHAPFLNLLFGLLIGLCAYFYTCAMLFDPGYVPKLAGLSQQKAVIDELITEWNYSENHFCVQCMVRMPLRSKHCKRCGRCVAKHDHHCPWIDNCVGVNNHRHFFLYIVTLALGVVVLVRLAIAYFEEKAVPTQCNILSDQLCGIMVADSFTIILVAWATVQLTWVTMLLIVQLVQIARAQTTYENMQRHRNPGIIRENVAPVVTAGSTSLEGAQLNGPSVGSDSDLVGGSHGHSHGHSHSNFFTTWKRLLGLDTFLATAQDGLDGRSLSSRRARNPYSRGMLTNCKDFLCDPAPVFAKRESGNAVLGGELVNYTRMYEPPDIMRLRTSGRDGGGRYEQVGNDDNV